MLLEAFAKINWSLDIVGVRNDGYHLLDMIMQPVSLSDEIVLEPASDLSISTDGLYHSPADETNLAFRAARALSLTAGIMDGVHIHIRKTIPVGAGMGGGSADAAAVLFGLNRLWQIGLSQTELEKVGLTIGADVPFCLHGGLVRTTGIGETISEFTCKNKWWMLVLQPCQGLSTREIFSSWRSENVRHPDNDLILHGLCTGNLGLVRQSMSNVLEPVSSERCPQIREAVNALNAAGASLSAMTGSGSAVFGVFQFRSEAVKAREKLLKRWPVIHLCHTQSESIRILEE